MTKINTITSLIERLTTLNNNDHGCSESSNRRTKETAQEIICQSGLDSDTIKAINTAISKESNPSGWYYNSNGIEGGLAALEAALNEQQGNSGPEQNKPLKPHKCFNLRNMQNLVSDGSIFYCEFTKRTTGELRKMKCRIGVRKHLKGGKCAYNAASMGLLSVFDMEAKGYRSIPINAIKRLTIGGQSFNFAGV